MDLTNKPHEGSGPIPQSIVEWIKGVRGCSHNDEKCLIRTGKTPYEVDPQMLLKICYQCCQKCPDQACERRVERVYQQVRPITSIIHHKG